MRTVAVVQARMGSERLPGKVLKLLNGRPMLEYVVENLRRARRLDEVAVAIPESSADDPLAEFCAARKYPVSRGSERDVLGRYAKAAGEFGAQAVVRVTADCPLIDPRIVDAVVNRHAMAGSNDYTCNVLLRTFPRGADTEVLSVECLRRLDREAIEPVYREHVTNYIHDHKSAFRIENVTRAAGDRSDLRLCVDTQEDFDLLEAVLQAVPSRDIEDAIVFLDNNPRIAGLNAHVRQKAKTVLPHAS